MTLKNIIYLPMLAVGSMLQASDATTLASKTQELLDKQSALSATLSNSNGGNSSNGGSSANTGSLQSFVYKNATNIPVILSITQNNMIIAQQVVANGTYTNAAFASDKIGISVHADLSPIFIPQYNPVYAYDLIINEKGALDLKQTATSGAVIVNKTGWKITLSFDLANNNNDETILGIEKRYTPNSSALKVTISPLIDDQGMPMTQAKALSIHNDNGNISLQ